jgi:prephenate dehydratase
MTEDKVERALEALKEKQTAIIADLNTQINHCVILNSTYKIHNKILFLRQIEIAFSL